MHISAMIAENYRKCEGEFVSHMVGLGLLLMGNNSRLHVIGNESVTNRLVIELKGLIQRMQVHLYNQNGKDLLQCCVQNVSLQQAVWP